MAWCVEYHSGFRIIEIRVEGIIPAAAMLEATQLALRRCQEHGVAAVLRDCSQFTGGCSAIDLYETAGLVIAYGKRAPYQEAVVSPSQASASADARFWETLCINQGLNVRVFENRAAALNWLVGTPEPLTMG